MTLERANELAAQWPEPDRASLLVLCSTCGHPAIGHFKYPKGSVRHGCRIDGCACLSFAAPPEAPTP